MHSQLLCILAFLDDFFAFLAGALVLLFSALPGSR